jgi:hypothetical protein
MIAWVGSAIGDHADSVPFSAAKMNRAGPLAVPFFTTKSLPPLKTIPVGLPVSSPFTAGIDTMSGFA